MQSIATSWGDTIEAMRALLRAALADPLNQRFLTLSDSDVPLYPATLTYLQLMQVSKLLGPQIGSGLVLQHPNWVCWIAAYWILVVVTKSWLSHCLCFVIKL